MAWEEDDELERIAAGRDAAARAVRGTAHNAGAAAITMSLAGLRTILLLRLLSPADFGVFALAVFFNNLAAQLRAIGLESALIQRREASSQTIATYFTLRLGLMLAHFAILLPVVPFVVGFYPDMPSLGELIVVYALGTILHGPGVAQETLLVRRLDFRRLARVRVAASASMTVVAPLLAWCGFGAWSLVGEYLAGELARTVLVWGPYRTWRPRLGWDREVASSMMRYGVGVWAGQSLNFLLQNLDDFWVGTTLGKVQLGFYSRAFDLGTYAQRGLWTPLNVLLPLFSRLQEDRLRLSKSFFRIASFVVRLGTGAFLVLALAARDGVVFFFGERWLPIVVPLQLMLAYRMLNLLASVAMELLNATGQPRIVARVRAFQVAVFVPALVLFAQIGGITGVALASVVMVAAATVKLHAQVRRYVDFSLARLLFWPAIALIAVPIAVLTTEGMWQGLPVFLSGAGKALVTATLYAGLLWLVEREQWMNGLRMVLELLRQRQERPAGDQPPFS